MKKNVKLRKGEKIRICRENYTLIRNLYTRRGFQFRTWLVHRDHDGKKFVAKITDKPDRALRELRTIIYLKEHKYPERYYAELVYFDHQATIYRNNEEIRFYALLLKYLPHDKFQSLDDFLKGNPDNNTKRKIAGKLKRRVERLHKLKVSHGDIREANVMVGKTRKGIGVRLIDFGLSDIGNQEKIGKDKKALERIIKRLTENRTINST